MAPNPIREFQNLSAELREQEWRARDLHQKEKELLRQKIAREELAAENVRYRMYTERMNGIGSLNPNPVHPALLAPPGGYAAKPYRPPMPDLDAPALPPGAWPDFLPDGTRAHNWPATATPAGFGQAGGMPPGSAQAWAREDLQFQQGSQAHPQAPPQSQHDIMPPADDPETRHEAVKERCMWLYLKGRLEGFEVLRPDFVFDGVDARASPSDFRGSGRRRGATMVAEAAVAVKAETTREELKELYAESLRRMDVVQCPLTGPATSSAGAQVCSGCGNTYSPGARFCRKCGRPRDEPAAISGQSQSAPSAARSPATQDGLAKAFKDKQGNPSQGGAVLEPQAARLPPTSGAPGQPAASTQARPPGAANSGPSWAAF